MDKWYGTDEPDEEFEWDEGDEGCEGHESLRGDKMGETVFCDGTCVNRAKWNGSPNRPQF